jgi:hypothetical protein
MRATVWVCALITCFAVSALGDPVNVIYQHNGNLVYGTHYTIAGPPENAGGTKVSGTFCAQHPPGRSAAKGS